MFDVAWVASRLTAFAPALTTKTNASSKTDQSKWIAFLAALHDLGKASPAFQLHPSLSPEKLDVVRQKLTDAGLPFSRLRDRRGASRQVLTQHGAITASVLPRILADRYGFSPEAASTYARVVGAHHGQFATSDELGRVDTRAAGDAPWRDLREAIVDDMANIVGVPKTAPPAPDQATATALAGFFSVVDWIGSMERYFPHAIRTDSNVRALDLRSYAVQSAGRAEKAVAELTWLADSAPSSATTFESLFSEIAANALQHAVIETSRHLAQPSLVIVEAPTGEGKTEAAMYLSQQFAERLGHHGCYFALPTQATSNQMFSRVRRFLERARTGEVNLQLLHGHASLSAEFETLRRNATETSPVAVYGDLGDESAVVAAEWFTYRKRGLLAPFGVGTVDQALMAVLQTRHYFVRLFGLAGKTIVIDEVHAYDAYMTTLMERLLEWLGALGSSVVLLSATLPSTRRERLTHAYMKGLGATGKQPDSVPYPRLTWANREGQGAVTVAVSERARRNIVLEWIDAASLGKLLSSLLSDGGCAAVICNTVARAQEVYSSLKSLFPGISKDGEPELMLFHARYPFYQRDLREKGALVRFGKDGARIDFGEGVTREVRRPARAVIVATQVIEQSLDLDFDLMVSEFAPVDLLLQRAGRLHRHRRARPAGLETSRMLVMGPGYGDDGILHFGGGTEAVYDRHILLRSWLALRDRGSIAVPDDVEGIIESVYGERTCPSDAEEIRRAWTESEFKLNAKRDRYKRLAERNRVAAPGDEDLFEENAGLDEDNPEVHRDLQALTRLFDGPSVPVILLEAHDLPSLDSDREPSREQAIALLRHEVAITHREIASALLNDEKSYRPRNWRRSALLRHHRLLRLDAWGRRRVGAFEVVLDANVGLLFEKATIDDD